eukprot:CAMPEP_0119118654 /NCGR_PEP_ID=MMETSP1310-20130426/461_1 /TAXON_ID=464262 /ORGANISM="Genus nov. species nov., Strain RCC2339" /LENGTH=883 /DNA_ID=CAMNT_0007108041 /DNA_START=359 /DNA_END=3010 /DNA_ORIENTATION=+
MGYCVVRGSLLAAAFLVLLRAQSHSTCSDSLDGGSFEVLDFTFDSRITSYLWSEYNYDRVWLLTEQGFVYKSDDKGKTWKTVMTLLDDLLPDGYASDQAQPVIGQIMESAGGDIVWLLAEDQIYVTTNGGSTFESRSHLIKRDHILVDFEPHRNEPSRALFLLLHKDCLYAPTAFGERCSTDLEVTLDSGRTSTNVANRVYGAEWGAPVEGTDSIVFNYQEMGDQYYPFLHPLVSKMFLARMWNFGSSVRDEAAFEGNVVEETWEEQEQPNGSERVDFFLSGPARDELLSRLGVDPAMPPPSATESWGAPDAPRESPSHTRGAMKQTKLLQSCFSFFDMHGGLFAIQAFPGENEPSDYSGELQISHDMGLSFRKAQFPETLVEKHYLVLDGTAGNIFIHVLHGSEFTGSVYESSSDEYVFSLILHNVEYSERPLLSSFHRLLSLEGTYFATVSTEQLDIPAGHDDYDSTLETTGLYTVRTFNKGSKWSRIRAPESIPCLEPPCYLNLYGADSKSVRTPVLSENTAIGLVLGNGYVGEYLDDVPDVDEVATYFSRDGGLTFEMFSEYPHAYGMGDYGSIMLLANTKVPTDLVHYTWDQGLNIATCRFSEKQPIYVDEIISGPDPRSASFLLIGYSDDSSVGSDKKTGYVVYFDFAELHEDECRNPQGAVFEGDVPNPDTDYELFTPTDGDGDICVLGVRTNYTRRMRERRCYNSLEYNPKNTVTQICPCTRDDYLCDYCHEEDNSGNCVSVCEVAIFTQGGGGCVETWIPGAYRIVPGDKCTPKENDPYAANMGYWQKCPPESSGAGSVVAIVVVCIVAVCIILAAFYKSRSGGLTTGWSSFVGSASPSAEDRDDEASGSYELLDNITTDSDDDDGLPPPPIEE